MLVTRAHSYLLDYVLGLRLVAAVAAAAYQCTSPSPPPALQSNSLARVSKHMSVSMNGADEQGANQRVALYNLQPSGERQMWPWPDGAAVRHTQSVVTAQQNSGGPFFSSRIQFAPSGAAAHLISQPVTI